MAEEEKQKTSGLVGQSHDQNGDDQLVELVGKASLQAGSPEDEVQSQRAAAEGEQAVHAAHASAGKDSAEIRGDPLADGDGVSMNATPRPKFAAKCQMGHATEQARKLWLTHKGKKDDEIDEDAMSLVASRDPTRPIYYWQLFSVLGKERIMQLVRTFYENVYEDDEYTKLRKVFQKVPDTTPEESLEFHIQKQAQYWMDAFGGGKKYHGGFGRLEFHHRYNAMEVMNTEAATRWTFHMNRAIQSAELTEDPRVKECLCDFLKTHMDKYGEQFKFQTQKITFGQVCEEIVRDKRSSRRRDRDSEKEDAGIEKSTERKAKGGDGGAKKKGGGSKGRR